MLALVLAAAVTGARRFPVGFIRGASDGGYFWVAHWEESLRAGMSGAVARRGTCRMRAWAFLDIGRWMRRVATGKFFMGLFRSCLESEWCSTCEKLIGNSIRNRRSMDMDDVDHLFAYASRQWPDAKPWIGFRM